MLKFVKLHLFQKIDVTLRNTKDNASQQADTLKHVENLIKAIEISTTHYNDVSVVSQWFERASNADFNFPINDND